MKHILLFGAGKSASVLIDYLKNLSAEKHWKVTVADANEQAVTAKVGTHSWVQPLGLQIEQAPERRALIETADIVISMMPPALHMLVAIDCVAAGKHLLTASYISPDIQALQPALAEKKLLFLCEMGLDPGIDHMSAMRLINGIHQQGGVIRSFKSHCGGLVAPESDNNPWHYKISWNPRNVVLAGKAGAVYKQDGAIVEKSYNELFVHNAHLQVHGLAPLAWYPNRDSLPYMHLYQLTQTDTFIRTTLRYPDFCTGWQYLVAQGFTDETTLYETDKLSYRQFFEQFAGNTPPANALLQQQLEYLGWYSDALINKGPCSAADVLQTLLETKLALQPHDKDMIVMVHELEYELAGRIHSINASLVVKGKDNVHTAMAQTVGLPLGIAARLILEGVITTTGLQAPVLPGIYEPVLAELEKQGIAFTEKVH